MREFTYWGRPDLVLTETQPDGLVTRWFCQPPRGSVYLVTQQERVTIEGRPARNIYSWVRAPEQPNVRRHVTLPAGARLRIEPWEAA